jgi:hypothetical protein
VKVLVSALFQLVLGGGARGRLLEKLNWLTFVELASGVRRSQHTHEPTTLSTQIMCSACTRTGISNPLFPSGNQIASVVKSVIALHPDLLLCHCLWTTNVLLSPASRMNVPVQSHVSTLADSQNVVLQEVT